MEQTSQTQQLEESAMTQMRESLPLYFQILDQSTTTLRVRGGTSKDASIFNVTLLPEDVTEDIQPLRLINEKTGRQYELSVSKKEETGIRIFKLKNLETRIEVN